MNSKHITPKARKCKAKGCASMFTSAQPFRTWCSPDCGWLIASAKREQAETKKRQEERKRDREKREGMKTIRQRIKDAQDEFNRYIRLRDAHLPCICCGKPLQLSGVGGGYDAGHYRSRGAASHLRFDERNCHAQRKQCNLYGSGRAVDYRIGLIARIGEPAVLALEQDNAPRKWTPEELIEIRDHYRAKANQLAKQLEKEEV